MKRMIYAVSAVMMILSGCEYHPYYDGQPFRIYNDDFGLLESDGGHAYVPIVSAYPYVLEFYGGEGKNHSVEVADPDVLGYTYREKDLQNNFIDGTQLITASVILHPKQIGETSLTVTDQDTGESVQIYVHVCEAYKVMEVYKGGETFETGTILAFSYLSDSNDAKICRGSEEKLEVMTEARYEFLSMEDLLYLELFFSADSEGKPSSDGTEIRKLYQVRFEDGDSYSSWSMMEMLNLGEYQLQTRAAEAKELLPDNYYFDFAFVDVTDVDAPSLDTVPGDTFYASSTRLVPWAD